MASKLRIANTLNEVSDSVHRFIHADAPSNRELLNHVIKPLSEIGEVLIIGGLVRDLAFYGTDERPVSDIDLVVRGSPSALAEYAKLVGAEANKFGGYGLKTPAFKADFWAFSSTWAKQAGHVPIQKSEDLLRCTFFDWDAIIYSLRSRRVSAIDNYIGRLHSRVLDLNLEPNPSVKGNLVRALRRVMMWDVRPGPRLKRFIMDALRWHSWEDLVAAENNAFSTSYLSHFDGHWKYLTGVLHNPGFHWVGRDDLRQQPLFLDLPLKFHVTDAKEVGRIVGVRKSRRRNKSQTLDLFADE